MTELVKLQWKRNPKKSFKGRSLSKSENVACTATRASPPQFRSVFGQSLVGRGDTCTSSSLHLQKGLFSLQTNFIFHLQTNLLSEIMRFFTTSKTYLFPRTISSKRIWALWLPFQFLHGLVRLHLCSINNLCCRNDDFYITYCSYSQMLSFPCNFTYIWIGCHPNRLPILFISWCLERKS